MEPTDHNLRAFDEMHRRRRALRPGLPPIVKATLGDLTAKRVLHLHAGTGGASAELAEQGAIVTSLEPSEDALEYSREQWPKFPTPGNTIAVASRSDAGSRTSSARAPTAANAFWALARLPTP